MEIFAERKRAQMASVMALVVSAMSVAYTLNFVFKNTRELTWREPTGLIMGITGVAIAQFFVVLYQFNRRVKNKNSSEKLIIQLKKLMYSQSFWGDVLSHVKRIELLLLIPYLSLTWVLNLMPESYYDLQGSVNVFHVIMQLLVVDYFTYCFHLAEHNVPNWYILGHKAHHKFTNPQLFNAFDATIMDTVFVILFPLFCTAQVCHVNCWSYIAFGMTYSSHFLLIHSEFEHEFDWILKYFYVNTADDHHVHHKVFKYNYGHFFTIYDKVCGTYRAASQIKGMRVYEA